jgi:PHD/YefM family antitoxin component YafN of YafNO toxin-antitoxin module
MITTIQLNKHTKKKLDSLKIYNRESYNELILRLLEGNSSVNASRESLIETIEILSDPNIMRSIADSLKRVEKGDFGTSLEELEKELGV